MALGPAGVTLSLAVPGNAAAGERLVEVWQWSPELAVSLSFALDGLSLLFALLICGIGALVLIYAGGYLAGSPRLGQFYAFLLLFVLAFYYLPRFQNVTRPVSRLRDLLIALCMGMLMTTLVLAATATPPESRLAGFVAEKSKTVAHGSNIVNVILVDFRGLDTLGEMTVLGVAAFGVYALLKLGRRQRRARIEEHRPGPESLRRLLVRGAQRGKEAARELDGLAHRQPPAGGPPAALLD